eukprot:7227153-Karenia_brevis.AAC.1
MDCNNINMGAPNGTKDEYGDDKALVSLPRKSRRPRTKASTAEVTCAQSGGEVGQVQHDSQSALMDAPRSTLPHDELHDHLGYVGMPQILALQ